MITDPQTIGTMPPLVLGASGRIGTGFQRLARAGLWPGPLPIWQVRPESALRPVKAVEWDILTKAPPNFGDFQGIVCLAGAVTGDLRSNTDLALAAIQLALGTGRGPVLLTSSSAVYGRTDGAVAESAVCEPINDYGRAKLAMEHAVAARLKELGNAAPNVCILRIGNVAGADALLLAAARGPVTLDQFDDGQGPERSYVGMLTLTKIMTQLLLIAKRSIALPPILNIAAPAPVQMSALLQAAGLIWNWRPAPPDAMRRMVLDTSRLQTFVPPELLSADPAEIIRQSRCSGWAAK